MKPKFSAHLKYSFQKIIKSRDREFVLSIHLNVTVFTVKNLWFISKFSNFFMLILNLWLFTLSDESFFVLLYYNTTIYAQELSKILHIAKIPRFSPT